MSERGTPATPNDPLTDDDLSLPLQVITSETIPPSPNRSGSTIDCLLEYSGFSWLAYGASSLLVISHFPSPLSPQQTLIGRQVMELSNHDDSTVTSLAWSPSLPSHGDIAVAVDNFIYLCSPSTQGSFHWIQIAVLVHEYDIDAIKWTGSGDGVISVGVEVVLWKGKCKSWEIAWKFTHQHPQSMVSPTWSIEGPVATGTLPSADKEASKIVSLCNMDDNSGLLKSELKHPQSVSMIQWRPSVTTHSRREVLLTCCLDGTARLWSEVDSGKTKNSKQSFYVIAVVEVNQSLTGTLGTDIFLAWPTEMTNISDIGGVQLPCDHDGPGRCEWLIGYGPCTSLTFWAIHCLDDIAPLRFPRVTLWKTLDLAGTQGQFFRSPGNLNSEDHSLFVKAVISRGPIHGPPFTCSLFQLLSDNSLGWTHFNTLEFSKTQGESLCLDGHNGDIVQVAIHPYSCEIEYAVSLDSNGLLLFWCLPTISGHNIGGMPALFLPTWNLVGKLETKKLFSIEYLCLRWAPLVMNGYSVLLLGHSVGIDCLMIELPETSVERIVHHKLGTIPFASHIHADGPTKIFASPLPSTCRISGACNHFMLLGLWMNEFQALSWRVTLHSADISGSSSDCHFKVQGDAPEFDRQGFETFFADRRYCLVAEPCSSELPDSHNCDQVTTVAMVSPGSLLPSVQQKWPISNGLFSNFAPFHMVSGHADGRLRFWTSGCPKLPTACSELSYLRWELVGMLKAHKGPVTAICLSCYGGKIATTSMENYQENIGTLCIWQSVRIVDAGNFLLEDKISLNGDVVSLSWLSIGNGQLLLGVCLKNELRLYAQKSYRSQPPVNSGTISETSIWHCIAAISTSLDARDFFWGPGATPVLVYKKHFGLLSRWLFHRNKKNQSTFHVQCSKANIPSYMSGTNSDFVCTVVTDCNICNELSLDGVTKICLQELPPKLNVLSAMIEQQCELHFAFIPLRIFPAKKKKKQRKKKKKTMNNKRNAPSTTPPPPKRFQQQTPPPAMDEDEMDEDRFLEETLLEEEELMVLRDEALTRRLAIWKRPPLSPSYVSHSSNILFQQLEIDYVIGERNKELLPNSSGPAAILRIFGVSREGHSVCCNVHGFEPYFYISCPPGMGPDDISNFHRILEARMRETNRNSTIPQLVRRIEIVKKRSIMYYQKPDPQPFLKIVVALPTMVAGCRGILEKGIQIDGLGTKVFVTYESNVLFALRFMIDCNIVGGNWMEVPAGKYKKATKTMSYCQMEFDCLYSELISHVPEGGYSKMAPFRVLSFDIECAGRKGHFPEPKHDPVIQIANLVTLQGEDKPFVRNVMTLKSCAPIVGVDVMSFDTEREVLLAWRDFVHEVDPDIIIGYNICKFDLPYLIERADVLKVAEFPILGRIRNSRVRVKDTTFSSRQLGTRESKEVAIEGRVQFDLLQIMQRDYKLSSYSLNSVSAHFLGEQKEDVHHSIISDLQHGTSETRRRLAVYCLKDAYLPQRLLDKLMFIYNYVEMARVTGVPISFLLSRGQSIKVLSQLLRKAKQKNLVIPSVRKQGSGDSTFEGATVLEAKTGFFEKPIATLDFASLYPSIMMAYNLCYCTLVTPEDMRKLNLPLENVNKTPSGETFVKSDLQKGILPEILEELLAARKRAKADLKEAKDPLEKAVLDGRQLALKISANSVYGFTGATVGQLPCVEISSSVTSYGRQMIEHTKKLVQERFTTLGGYEHNAEVIYGDTDSVMVQFGVPTVDAAMNLGREAADYISGTFIKPIKLEFEKVYYPYLLISKKRYAGLLWTNPEKYDKMDSKGIETVRRDNCLLVKNLVTECLYKILIDRDVPGAVQYVKNTISDLLMNRMDLSLLVITKGLTKTGEDYAVKAAHVELADRMRKRDPATAPSVGDRVPYVIIKAAKGAKAYEKSEDPIYVLENNIPIDAQYYLENQIKKPLLRIFEPILKNASQELLHGSHTRSVSILTPSNTGIMKFAKKQLSCLGCKALLSNTEQTLCSHCKGREAELYCKTLANVVELENLFGRLWTQCQECQQSMHQDVLCTSRDCPIFYRRKKAQKDMAEAKVQLDRW